MRFFEASVTFAVCTVAQVAVYLLLRSMESGPVAEARKGRAWKLSVILSAWFGLVLGPLYVVSLLTAMAEGQESISRLLTEESNFGRGSAVYMVSFLILDLSVGMLDYKEHLRLDSSYIHHVAYTALYLYCLSAGLTQYLMVGTICEVPTLILGLGSISQSLRQDLLFGVTFFVTRIAWFVLLGVVWCTLSFYNLSTISPAVYLTPLLAALCAHLWWFYKWCQTYVKVKRSVK